MITDKELIEILNQINSDNLTKLKLYIITNHSNESFKNLLNSTDFIIQILPVETLIKIITTKNIYPIEQKTPIPQTKKQVIKTYILNKINLSRKQFIRLFLTGTSLLFLSLFIPFSFLYLLIGSLLLTLSIVCLFHKNIKPQTAENEFFETIKKG